MKTTIIAFTAILLISLGFYSCKKDNIYGDASNLVGGSYITLDSTINTSLDFSNDAATVSISVAEYGSPVASINIYLATGSNRTDSTGWVFIKNVPYTGEGTVLSVTTAEISVALAPDSITPGNQYTLENEVITKDGRHYSDVNTPTNYTSFPAYNFAFYWQATAVCPFSAAEAAGTYEVVTDSWADYSPGDRIVVSAGPGENQINFQGYPSPAYGTNTANTIVTVDPQTDVATIDLQATGQYSGGVNAQVEGSGLVFSCAGVINLSIDVHYGSDTYTSQTFVLRKVD